MAEGDDDDDKTEEPSQKKLDDALERGDVVKSQEVSTFFLLGATTVFVALMAGNLGRDLSRPLAAIFDHVADLSTDGAGLTSLYLEIGRDVLGVMVLPALVFVVAGIAGNMIQHRLVWSMDPLQPKLSKVSPLEGFKRLFSVESLVNLVKGLAKLVVVSGAIWMAVRPELGRLQSIVASEPEGLLAITQRLAVKLMTAVMIVMALIAGLDYFFQRQRWMKKHRMSRQEQKEEYKQSEGSPEIKAKIRQIRQSRSRKRMMAAVPTATVVVTNPTHYAVALRYEQGMQAPICVAKGIDDLALKIREIAKGHQIPVIENPPLARALHASVDIDGEVPEEHYRAVAEVIGFVMRLRQSRGWKPS